MLEVYGNLVFIYPIGIFSTLILSLFSYYIILKKKIELSLKSSKAIFFFSLCFYIVSIFVLSNKKIDALHHYADFATHLEILWNNFTGDGLISLMSSNHHKGEHWFAGHFTPIIYLTYIPFFSIFPDPKSIQLVETFFILSSLLPLSFICRYYFDKKNTYIFISCFIFYPTIFYTNLYGIAYLELAIPLILWLIFFSLKQKKLEYFVCLILCLIVREEVSLVLSFFGLFLIFKRQYFLGFITFISSLSYFFIVMFMIMPLFKDGAHISLGQFSELGSTYVEIINNIIFNFFETISKIINIPKLTNLIIYLLPLLFSSIFSFLAFCITIPNISMVLLSNSITHSSFILYYLSPSIPIFFYASVLSINKLRKIKFLKINIHALVFAIFISSISTTVFFGATPISLPFWFKNYEVGKFYTTDFHFSAYRVEQNDIVAKELALMIPDDANVSAEQHFLPLLYKKRKMTVFPFVEQDTSYILIDKFGKTKTGWTDTYLEFRNNPNKFYKKYLDSDKWQIIKSINGVMLLKKNNF